MSADPKELAKCDAMEAVLAVAKTQSQSLTLHLTNAETVTGLIAKVGKDFVLLSRLDASLEAVPLHAIVRIEMKVQ